MNQVAGRRGLTAEEEGDGMENVCQVRQVCQVCSAYQRSNISPLAAHTHKVWIGSTSSP